MKKLLLFFMLSITLSGCTTKYDRSDIIDKVQADLNLRNFKVSNSATVVVDDKGYNDKIWTVTIPETGLVFHVMDDWGWGLESVTNSLKHDYDKAVIHHIYNDLPTLHYLQVETSIEDSGLCSAYIIGNFENEKELKGCYGELELLRNAFISLGYSNLSISYRLNYQHPLRNLTPPYEDQTGDSHGLTSYQKSYQEVKNNMIQSALDYRYEFVNRLTPQEIADALIDYDDRVGIYTGTQENQADFEPSKIHYYDDIIANKYSYGISFSSLYEILKREGFDVQGNSWHYTFTGIDDIHYEISYDFTDYDFEDKKGYYYLADEEKIPMSGYFYNHFRTFQIEEMTGLRLVDDFIENDLNIQ